VEFKFVQLIKPKFSFSLALSLLHIILVASCFDYVSLDYIWLKCKVFILILSLLLVFTHVILDFFTYFMITTLVDSLDLVLGFLCFVYN